MARDRLITTHKLTRVESALAELIECADVQFVPTFEAAQRAVRVLGLWHDGELAANGRADEAEDARELTAAEELAAGPALAVSGL